MKIYTKAGDRGETGLRRGTRVPKDHLRVEAYGQVDELNATVGLAIAFLSDTELVSQLLRVQRDLFSLGSQLADPGGQGPDKVEVGDAQIAWLEQCIDRWEAELPPLHRFILPGGVQSAAFIHLARTVCRRAERSAVRLSHTEQVPPQLLVYLNRLSDFLFVLARCLNHRSHTSEMPW
ncbi:MAG: cob(I)yrinic acid a,c-diamide adenosyltransferase [Acidobacteriota bacterium]